MATSIYHITHMDNLARILQTKGLWCDVQRKSLGFDLVGIAHQGLKDRRARTPARRRDGRSVAAGGMLANYVPFYFTNRSPTMRRSVQEVLVAENATHQPPVNVQAKWYY
jgi:hypothetical protein